MQFDYSLCAKWLELLKQIAPETKRVGVLRDPVITEDIGQFAVIQSVASSVGVEVSPINLGNAGNTEASIAAFARSLNEGMIVTAGALAVVNRDLIIALAARHKLTTLYANRAWAADGGLIPDHTRIRRLMSLPPASLCRLVNYCG